MKRRTKMDQKAVRTASSALAVVDTDVNDGLYKKAGTYGWKAAYIDEDGGAI